MHMHCRKRTLSEMQCTSYTLNVQFCWLPRCLSKQWDFFRFLIVSCIQPKIFFVKFLFWSNMVIKLQSSDQFLSMSNALPYHNHITLSPFEDTIKYLQSLADRRCFATVHCSCLYWGSAVASSTAVDRGRHQCHCELPSAAESHRTGGQTRWLGRRHVTTAGELDQAGEWSPPAAEATAIATRYK